MCWPRSKRVARHAGPASKPAGRIRGGCAISFIEFPLRLEGSFLKRTGEPEAILRFIEMMARTPGGSWPGCRTFGVRQYFEGMRTRPEGLKQAEKAINDTLADLGIRHYRLQSIRRDPSPNADVDVYSVTIVSTADPGAVLTARLGE